MLIYNNFLFQYHSFYWTPKRPFKSPGFHLLCSAIPSSQKVHIQKLLFSICSLMSLGRAGNIVSPSKPTILLAMSLRWSVCQKAAASPPKREFDLWGDELYKYTSNSCAAWFTHIMFWWPEHQMWILVSNATAPGGRVSSIKRQFLLQGYNTIS